mgnify:CR=1 FL=1
MAKVVQLGKGGTVRQDGPVSGHPNKMVQLAKMAKVRTCTNKEQAIDKYTKIRKHLKYIQGNKK